MKHYLVEVIDENSENEGEEFLVGADTIEQAREIVKKWWGDTKVKIYKVPLSEYEAESSGLDEY